MNIVSKIFISSLFLISTAFAQGYKPGDKAIDFSLKNVDGNMVSMKALKDAKGVIVVFTCNHCPYSQMYESRIIDLNNKYASKGFPVVAINSNDYKEYTDDSPENMAKIAKEKKYTFPYLIDETQDVAKAYGAQKTPHVFLLNKSGAEFVVEYIGAIDDNPSEAKKVKEKFLEKAIEEVMQGKPVSTKTVKAIGCGIKWKS